MITKLVFTLILVNLNLISSDKRCRIPPFYMKDLIMCCDVNMWRSLKNLKMENCEHLVNSGCVIDCVVTENNLLEDERISLEQVKAFLPSLFDKEVIGDFVENAFDKCINNALANNWVPGSERRRNHTTKNVECEPNHHVRSTLFCVQREIIKTCPADLWNTNKNDVCDNLRQEMQSCE